MQTSVKSTGKALAAQRQWDFAAVSSDWGKGTSGSKLLSQLGRAGLARTSSLFRPEYRVVVCWTSRPVKLGGRVRCAKTNPEKLTVMFSD